MYHRALDHKPGDTNVYMYMYMYITDHPEYDNQLYSTINVCTCIY